MDGWMENITYLSVKSTVVINVFDSQHTFNECRKNRCQQNASNSLSYSSSSNAVSCTTFSADVADVQHIQ